MANEMPMPLEGKTVLITGAARRVGAAIPRRMHAAGANIALHYRNSDAAADTLADELQKVRSGSVQTFKANLLDLKEIAKLVEAAVESFGRLDILVNNAS